MHSIYRLQNTIKGKAYIGLLEDISQLVKRTDSYLGTDIAIYTASKFRLDKLEEVESSQLQDRIGYWIIKYRTLAPGGYNRFLGRNKSVP